MASSFPLCQTTECNVQSVRAALLLAGMNPDFSSVHCILNKIEQHCCACRFAHHLEKCMGVGRSNRRMTSRRANGREGAG